VMVTVEEGSVGGFGSHVMQYLSDQSLLDGALKFRSFVLPDIFIDHDAPAKMYDVAGLNAEQIVARVAELMQADITPLSVRPAQN
jgi:1-deoxy-D-xylulose-5-phosphate synthase